MDIDKLAYTPAMLARLAYSHAAFELSERLVSEAATHSDAYGRGAFLTEEALTTFVEAEGLLAAAVIADRMRGASWQAATSGSPGSPAPDECSLRDACDRAQNRPCFPVQTASRPRSSPAPLCARGGGPSGAVEGQPDASGCPEGRTRRRAGA